MAPPGRFQSAKHYVRHVHPLRGQMRRTLRRLEWSTPDEVAAYQERRLRLLVRLAAARAPYYRRWFAEAGVDPASIRSLADLDRLPQLERSDLVDNDEAFLVYPQRLMWATHSSGTSGSVITSHRTPGSSAYELSVLERQWGWFGVAPRSRRILLRRDDPDPHGTGALTRVVRGSRQMVVSSYRLGATDLDRLLPEMRAYRPVAIEGWPSSITVLASRLHERGESFPVTAVITSSEVMTVEQRRLMREVFRAPVVDHYGQSERVAMAGVCEAGGYHVFPDYGIVELIPVTGVPDRFEIVGTPLHNWGFTVFRYRTGDQVSPAPEGPCPCGRSFPLIGQIDGRIEDNFTAADGRPLPSPGRVTDNLTGLREVQVAQLAPGHFEFRLAPSSSSDIEATKVTALRDVERYFGPGQTVTFRVMDTIPRSPGGKLRSAVSTPPGSSAGA